MPQHTETNQRQTNTNTNNRQTQLRLIKQEQTDNKQDHQIAFKIQQDAHRQTK